MMKIMEKSEIDLELLFLNIELLSLSYNGYHRKFIVQKIAPFVKFCLSYLRSTIPDSDLKTLKKEKLEPALSNLERLMRRVFTVKKKIEESMKTQLEISLRMLKSDLLKRRIEAINILSEICRSAKSLHALSNSVAVNNEIVILKNELPVGFLIEQVFGKWSHIQLIQRFSDILNFFMVTEMLTPSEYEIIWECCMKDQQSKVEIYNKMLKDSLYYLSDNFLIFIINKFSELVPANFSKPDLQLLIDLSLKFKNLPKEMLYKALDILWNVNHLKNEYTNISAEMRENALEKLCDIITTPYHFPETLMTDYFNKACKLLDENYDIPLSLKCIRRALSQLPLMKNFVSKPDMIIGTIKSFDIFTKIYSVFL